MCTVTLLSSRPPLRPPTRLSPCDAILRDRNTSSECDLAAGFMPRISLSEPGLFPKAVSHASGFPPLCDDDHAACRRLCLTKHVPRLCCHLDCGQHDLGCKSRNFQRRCVAAWLIRSASSIGSHSLLEEEPSHTVSLPNYQEDVSMLRVVDADTPWHPQLFRRSG